MIDNRAMILVSAVTTGVLKIRAINVRRFTDDSSQKFNKQLLYNMNAIVSFLIIVLSLASSSSCLPMRVNYTEHTLAIFNGYKMPSLKVIFLNESQEVDVGSTGFKMQLSNVTVAPAAPFKMISNYYPGSPVDGQSGLHKLWGRVMPKGMVLSMSGTASYWRPGTREGANVNFVANNMQFPFFHIHISYDVIFNPTERQVNQVNITLDTTNFRPKSGFENCNEFGVKGLCDSLEETVKEVLNEGREFNNHPILSRAIAQQLEKDRRNY